MRLLAGDADEDLQRYYPKMEPTARRIIKACLRSPGLLAVVLMRAQTRASRRGKKGLAERIRFLNHTITGADFVVGCTIGPGLLIHHPNGIVVGRGVTIGSHCTILQQVTLGERFVDGTGDHAYPRVGDFVSLGAGAKVIGGVQIGNGATVGANAVVLRNVDPGTVAVGAPARSLGTRPRGSS